MQHFAMGPLELRSDRVAPAIMFRSESVQMANGWGIQGSRLQSNVLHSFSAGIGGPLFAVVSAASVTDEFERNR